ncbi:hypothetical protein K4F52_009335 [Lecanicillium sp. MT-2017a]|nr:hypothetical protein K4F52_009335 [Lecanicillium sp. MT-2017a]
MSDTTAINQAYFNKIASEYDQRYAKTIGPLEEEMKASIDFIGIKEGGRLLDYACGTGLLSRAFQNHVGQCVGVDVSESMVEAYNAKAKSENIPPEKRFAHIGNLLSVTTSPNLDAPEFTGFDVAGVGAGFHHFDDPTLAATRIGERLAPGGSFFILDFVPHDVERGHSAAHGVKHHGFSEETMRGVFEGAGVGGAFAYKLLDSEVTFENAHGEGKHMHRRFFLARGTKTA